MNATRWFYVLALVTALAAVAAPTLVSAPVLADDAAQAPADSVPGDHPNPVPTTDKPPDPIPVGCEVSRNCAYPPPVSVACTSFFGECSEGSDGYGWVECDGHRYYCSGPSCSGSGSYCKSNSDCSSPNPCTCGQGYCSSYSCICPNNPDP